MTDDLDRRLAVAADIARRAGALGMEFFRSIDSLKIESKGHQDLVSNADRDVETFVRAELAAAFPGDGIVGEEHAPVAGTTGRTWIIDPIDGTANFVRGIPAWCVVIAGVRDGVTEIGVIFEPSSGEMFLARRGGGATANGKPIRVSSAKSLGEGSVGTGFSNRRQAMNIVPVVQALLSEGGFFYRNASGALMLAYVAAGRLLGYVEEHMNAWDCLAALLMIEEAGGIIHRPDPATVVEHGTYVLAAAPGIYGRLEAISAGAFSPE